MDPQSSVWKSSLEDFARELAAGDGITGAVAVASISATFAVHLVRMVLEITSRKKESESQSRLLRGLLTATRIEAEQLRLVADEDRAVYAAYREASRLPRSTEAERAERDRAMRFALEQATETPLRAARSAVRAIELCAQAAPLARGDVAADIGGAAEILNGAVRAILTSVDANLRRIANGKLKAERQELEELANRYAKQVRDALRAQTN